MSSATRKGGSSIKNGSTKFKPTFNYLVAIGDEECARTMLGAMYRNLLEAREIINELPYGTDEERHNYGFGEKVSESIEVEPYCDSWSLSELELKIHTPFCREPVLAFNPKSEVELDPTDEGGLLSVARTMLDSEPAERGKLSLTSPNAQKLYVHKRADLEKAEEERARAEEEARKAEFENGPVARQLKDLIVLYTGCVPYSQEEVPSWKEDDHRISNGAFSRKNDLSEGYEGKTWLEAFERVVSSRKALSG